MHHPLAFCHELFGDRPFEEQCQILKSIGYDGLELAPFRLAPDIRKLSRSEIASYRTTAEKIGINIPAMHWLLLSPTGMHITSPDTQIYHFTSEYFHKLIEIAHQIGVKYLVFGSPKQRSIQPEWDPTASYNQAIHFFQEMGDIAQDLGLIIAFEPLGPSMTNFGGLLSESVLLIDKINHKAVKIHLDVSAMYRDPMSWKEQIHLVGKNRLVYVHLNDPNQLGPGMGEVDVKPIIEEFNTIGYTGWFSVEPFRTDIAPEIIADLSYKYLFNIIS